MVTLHLVQQAYAQPAEMLADAYDLTLAGYAAERADGGDQQEAPMSTPEDLALEALSVQARLVAKLRAAKAEGDKAWERTRPDAEWEPDDPPEDPPDLSVLAYGNHWCICGGQTKRIGGEWWCTNQRWHLSRPDPRREDA